MSVGTTVHIRILFAGRFPSEKAASLFVDLNARSLVEAGAEVTVLAPRRLLRERLGQVPYSVVYLPTIDLSRIPFIWKVANYISVAVYSKMVFFWLLFKSEKTDVTISNDVLPLLAASLIRKNLMYEMHDFPDRSRAMYSLLFKRVRWILATNEWKAKEVARLFPIEPGKVFIERNAVDTSAFGHISCEQAREALGLDQKARIATYTGHLYEWKGADTFAAAAELIPDVTCIFVGGMPADVERFKKKWGHVPNIRIIGQVEHDAIPLWQSAADVLVVPNSAKEEISVHYTSPMKLFEYMASERKIVASDLPSIREILPDGAGYFAQADDAVSFAHAVTDALSDTEMRARLAREAVADHTWQKRAERILGLIV